MLVHEFYHLKALITLEQVNTTEWLKKKRRILISKTLTVRCCKLLLYANESGDEHVVYFLAMIEMMCHVNHFFDPCQ